MTLKNRNGFTLLEVLIAAGIISALMPILLTIFFQFQKTIQKIQTQFQIQNEINYIDQFIRQDLKSATQILETTHHLKFQIGSDSIAYRVTKGKLFRDLTRPAKGKSTFSLNQTVSFTELEATQHHRQFLSLTLSTDQNPMTIQTFLPNVF